MKRFSLGTLAGLCLAGAALAEGPVVTPYAGSFGDATFALENEILDRGLVIDHTSHVGDMLARTRADVGSSETIFEAADVYMFCSAVLSREVMEADPMNIAYCPYGIFVADRGGDVFIGHRNYPEGEMQQVQTLLTEIIQDAVGE